MRSRLLLPLALTAVAAAALAFPAGGAAVRIPKGIKTAKVLQYPVTVDVVGYIEHTWTWDNTEPCRPGYAKTIEEDLGFELGSPRAGKISIVNGTVMMGPVFGGDATLQTSLSNWRTTNFCPPEKPLPEPPEPVCKKKLKSKLGVAIAPVKEEGEEDDPTPLVHQTQVAMFRSPGSAQAITCHQDRPRIEAEGEGTNGWHADPLSGIIAPLKATDVDFLRLGVGKTLRRTIQITGGCARASFSRVSPYIRSCVVKGKAVVMVKRTGRGFSTY